MRIDFVLQQGETCVSNDFMQENVAHSEIFVEILAKAVDPRLVVEFRTKCSEKYSELL